MDQGGHKVRVVYGGMSHSGEWVQTIPILVEFDWDELGDGVSQVSIIGCVGLSGNNDPIVDRGYWCSRIGDSRSHKGQMVSELDRRC